MVYLKEYFGWPDQPSGLDATKYKNEITHYIVVDVAHQYFETKRSGGNDEQNKQDIFCVLHAQSVLLPKRFSQVAIVRHDVMA